MRLDEYRKKVGISQQDFGGTLSPPVGQSLVSQWELGETRVSLPYALDIEKKTDRQVTTEDCLKMFTEPKSREKSGA